MVLLVKFLLILISDLVEGAAAGAAEHWLKCLTWGKAKIKKEK